MVGIAGRVSGSQPSERTGRRTVGVELPSRPVEPPIAPQRRHVRDLHGELVVDDYFWLRERNNPEVLAYLQAENAYTDAGLEHTKPLQEAIFTEIKERTQETDLAVPARRGDWWYSTRTEEGKPYRIWVRMRGAADGPEEVLIDENALAVGHEYLRVVNVGISPDDSIVSYSIDTNGSERYRTRFRRAGTDEEFPDEIPLSYYGAAWASDCEHYFYSVPDAAMRPWQIWRHRLGTDPATDELVYQEDDDRFFLSLHRSRSEEFLIIAAGSATTSDARVISADDPTAEPRLVLPRVPDVEYSLDHAGDDFWVVSNEDAVDGRLLRIPASGGPAAEVVPHRAGAKLAQPDCFAHHVIVWGRRDGLSAALSVPRNGGDPHYLEMDEAVYEISPDMNLEFETTVLRYRYQSPVTPPSVFDHDLESGERVLLKRTPVLGDFDAARYVASREWATAPDGARIPITVVKEADVPVDGTAPLLLYGYGAYEISMPAAFSIPRLSLLDRGVVFAIAHVRGGGELGKRWYEEGKLAQKMNTFTDFIACAEHLSAAGFADPSRVAARGGSAGGLTVGAAITLRPDRFAAAVAEVPFVDVINTMLDEALPLTIVEWEEWGNPAVAEQYGWMRAYAPYENATGAEWPALLVTAGLNDPRVQYWEPAKWVAKLRGAGAETLLLKTELGAGHFARSGRYDVWRDEALVLAFVLDQLGAAAS
jgi:oligopeptidase B